MNTEGKTTKTLDGVLLRPLAVGTKTVILHQGQITLTSRVETIYSRTEDEVCFETKNTHYRLLTGPTYESAVSLLPMAMAA